MKQLVQTVLLALLILGVYAIGASLAHAEPVVQFALGANGVWYDSGAPYPNDVEVGSNASVSLSQHISAVGSAYYGINQSLLSGDAGGRVTVTDADNQNFSIGLGATYQMSSEADKRPQEWIATAVAGWRPWPVSQPRASLILRADRGFDSKSAAIKVGGRLSLGNQPQSVGVSP